MRKNAPNSNFQAEPWAPNTYQTGSTTPPKSRNGLIAVLLVVVILLCGVVTVLGITNVKLFRILSGQEDSDSLPVFFAGSRNSSASEDSSAMSLDGRSITLSSPLGIEGESVPKVHQLYYGLPCGLYVVDIEQEASAFRRGLQPGDIITHVDGFAIEFEEDFAAALLNYAPGDLVTLTVYRNANTFPVIVEVQPSR